MSKRLLIIILLFALLFGLYLFSIKMEQENNLPTVKQPKSRKKNTKDTESEDSINQKILINEISESETGMDDMSNDSFSLVSNNSMANNDDNESLASFQL